MDDVQTVGYGVRRKDSGAFVGFVPTRLAESVGPQASYGAAYEEVPVVLRSDLESLAERVRELEGDAAAQRAWVIANMPESFANDSILECHTGLKECAVEAEQEVIDTEKDAERLEWLIQSMRYPDLYNLTGSGSMQLAVQRAAIDSAMQQDGG